MNQFIIPSKIYTPRSSKGHTLMIVTSVVLILAVILAVISFFVFGFNWANISTVILAAVISIRVKTLVGRGGKYTDCTSVAVLTGAELQIGYYQYCVDKKPVNLLSQIYVSYSDITALQHSDKLQCLRIAGCIRVANAQNQVASQQQELLYYIAQSDMEPFCSSLSAITRKPIVYMDRPHP